MNDTVATKAQDTLTSATSPELRRSDRTRTVEYHQGQRYYTAPTGRTYDRSRPMRSARRKPAKRPFTYGGCGVPGLMQRAMREEDAPGDSWSRRRRDEGCQREEAIHELLKRHGDKRVTVAFATGTSAVWRRRANYRRRKQARLFGDDDFDAPALERANVLVADAIVGDEGVNHVERA